MIMTKINDYLFNIVIVKMNEEMSKLHNFFVLLSQIIHTDNNLKLLK